MPSVLAAPARDRPRSDAARRLAPARRAAHARDAARWVAIGLAAAYAIGISWLAVAQHATFHTRARDMGIYAQVLWNTSHGRPFASTLLEDNTLHLAEHVAPVLVALAPLYALWPDPRLILVIQQVCLAATGLVIFAFARRRLGDLPALALMLGFYAMPAMSRIALSEFHPIKMAALPVALGLVAILEGRARAAAVWLILALLVEEETTPLVGAAGAYLLVARRRPIGLALGGLAAVWLVVVVLILMPAFHDRETLARAEGNRTFDHYRQVTDNPRLAIDWLIGERGWHAALWLVAPTGGLALLAPHVVALAAPSFAILFLQDRETTVAGHWSAAMQPVFWLAAATGVAILARRFRSRRDQILFGCSLILLVGSALSFARFSQFPGGRGFDEDRFEWTDHEERLARAVSFVPPAARLDATRRVVPHLANRSEVYQFPSTFYSAPMRPDLAKIEAFVLDLTDSPTRRALDPTDQDTVLTKRPRLHVRALSDDVIVATRARPSPTRTTEALFGEVLRLNGYDLERRPNGHIWLTAYWEPTARHAARTRVVELVAADGRALWQGHQVPLEAPMPPNRWERGQVVAETIEIELPPGHDPAQLQIALGWLDASGRPMAVHDGTERVLIALSGVR